MTSGEAAGSSSLDVTDVEDIDEHYSSNPRWGQRGMCMCQREGIRRSICPSWQPGHQENMSWSCVRTLACAAKKVCIAWRSGLLGIRYDLNHGNYSKGVKLREWTSRMSLTCVTSSKKWELMAKTFLPNSGVASTYYFVHDSLYIGTHRWKQCAPRWGSS